MADRHDIAPEARAVALELERRGYRRTSERYDEEHFGNVVILFEGDHTRVRMVRDRGQWFVEVAACGSDDWFAPVIWRDALGTPTSAAETLSFSAQARLLAEDLHRIEAASASSDPAVVRTLRNARDARAASRRRGVSG